MHKLWGIIIIIFVLSGCHHQDSYQYLTTHPKILEQLLNHCNTMPISQASEDASCMTAENARQEVTVLLNEIQTSLQGFGQKIIAAQIKLTDLKTEYQHQPSSKLAAAIQDQEDYIARLLVICSYVGE